MKTEVGIACAALLSPRAEGTLGTVMEEVTVMTPGAWESGRENYLCPGSVESLPGTRTGDFRVPESLTKENYIFKKKLFKGLALCRGGHKGVARR